MLLYSTPSVPINDKPLRKGVVHIKQPKNPSANAAAFARCIWSLAQVLRWIVHGNIVCGRDSSERAGYGFFAGRAHELCARSTGGLSEVLCVAMANVYHAVCAADELYGNDVFICGELGNADGAGFPVLFLVVKTFFGVQLSSHGFSVGEMGLDGWVQSR